MKGMIGLEIHVYVVTKEKLFCRCKASRERGTEPNTLICPICTGQPGAKPYSPNADAVRKAVQIALLLGCKVNDKMTWMRKHYSWPDLPKGYQNTLSGAHATPLGVNGRFEGVSISSMHLEEDPASWDPATGCVDYNRSGLPLVEIVTEPDFTNSEQVGEWLTKLTHALSYLKVVDSNAGIKVDVNVSIPGKTQRVEIKNVSSIESSTKAIDYELTRQLKEGSVRETRRYDSVKDKTVSMRSKEQQDDYRFIPDPDLPILNIEKKLVSELRNELPETPSAKLEKLIKSYNIDKKHAAVLAKNLDVVELFEKIVKGGEVKSDLALHWINVELLRVLNWNKKMLHEVDIKAEHFIELLKMIENKTITELQGKQILNKFVPKSFSPGKTEGRIDDKKELEDIAKIVIKKNAKAVRDYRAGDVRSLNFLIGEMMKATNRRADFKIAKELLEKLLS